jgi:hypothetical protein
MRRQPLSEPLDRQSAAVAVLDARRADHHGQQEPERVNDDMSFSAGDFLARVVAAPPFCGASVLTDWASIPAAEGVGFLPALRRTFWLRLS